MGSPHSIHEKIRKQDERIAEWHRTSTTSTTPALSQEFHDEADLSVENNSHVESADVTLDQSNHGFSFINLHWASFSTGLSSVLAVIVCLILISGCCYFRGRRQRQSRTRHAELLRSIVHGASKAASTVSHPQSGSYPGPAPPVQSTIQRVPSLVAPPERVIFEPSVVPAIPASSGSFPVVRYTPPSASCGLPGCSTTYDRRAITRDSKPLMLTLDGGHQVDIVPSAPPSFECSSPSRNTGIHALGR